MNKTDKPTPKTVKDVKAISKNPLPDKTVSAEIIKRRTSKK
jgi:hypothetical protein